MLKKISQQLIDLYSTGSLFSMCEACYLNREKMQSIEFSLAVTIHRDVLILL